MSGVQEEVQSSFTIHAKQTHHSVGKMFSSCLPIAVKTPEEKKNQPCLGISALRFPKGAGLWVILKVKRGGIEPEKQLTYVDFSIACKAIAAQPA